MTERDGPARRSWAAAAWRQRWLALAVATSVLLGGWAWLAARPGAYTAQVDLTIDATRVLRALTSETAASAPSQRVDDRLVQAMLTETIRTAAASRLTEADEPGAARALAALDHQDVAIEALSRNGYRLTVLAADPTTAGRVAGAIAATFRDQAVAATRTDWQRVIGEIEGQIGADERARDEIEGRITAFEKQNMPMLKEMADLDTRLNKLRMMAGDLDLFVLEANAERDLLRRELQVTPPLIAYAVPPSTSPGEAPAISRSPVPAPPSGGLSADRATRSEIPPSALTPAPSTSPLTGLEGVNDRRGMVTMARQRLAQLQTALAKLRQVYTEQHPDVQIVRRQIELLRTNFPELSRPTKPGRPQPATAQRNVVGKSTPARPPSVAGGPGAVARDNIAVTVTPPGSRPPAAIAGPPVRKALPATINNTPVSGPAQPNPAYQELSQKLAAREADIAKFKARSARARGDAAVLEKKTARGAVVAADLERMDAERRAIQARLDSLSLERNELLAARAADARGERDAVRVLSAPVASLKPADRGGLRFLAGVPVAAGGAGVLAGLLASVGARRREEQTLATGATAVGDETTRAAPRRSSPLLAGMSALAFVAVLGMLAVGQLVMTQMEAEHGLNALVRAAQRQDSLAPIAAAARQALTTLKVRAESAISSWR